MSARRGARLLALLPVLLIALLLGWTLAGGVATAAPTFPPLNGQRVVDQANVLAPDVRENLTAKLAELEAKTSRQLVVVTVSDLQGYDIAEYGYQLGRAWGIGRKGISNGVLFIVAPKERKTRIEVGYGLEGVLTDALSSVILREKVLPWFRNGDMAAGITNGTLSLIDQLSLDPSTAEQKAAAAAQDEKQSASAGHHRSNVLGIIWTLMVATITLLAIFGRGRSQISGWFWPLLLLAGSSRRGDGGGGGFSSGDGGGFSSDSGGGFSGGGGDFGGGGASGDW